MHSTTWYQNGSKIVTMPRNYIKVQVIVDRCGDDDQISNKDSKLKSISTEKQRLKRKRLKHTHRFKDRVSVIQQE